MIQSMTGFGFSKLSNKNFEISCEIKSVNSKFIDIHFKSAQQSFSVEEHLNQKLKSVFSRGQFDVRLNILGGISPKLSINNDVLAQLNKEIKKSKHLETATLKFSDIKNFPGAVSLSEDSAISDAHLTKVINKAIDDLRHSRLSEGNKILKVLNIKIKNILSIETSLRKMISSINRQRKKNVKERLNHFLENPSEEIEKEIALQIMKQDVSEELDRIGFHIKEINKILKSNGSHGKKIDFMLQELFREANTLSVKLDNSKAKKLAINLKILVEELREQTQNIQ